MGVVESGAGHADAIQDFWGVEVLDRCILAIAALAVVTLQASAATVHVNEGVVSVSRGQGYEPIGSGAAVGPGDKVLVANGGSATIVYSPGCQVPVGSGQVVTIPVELPCFATTTAVAPEAAVGGAMSTSVIGGRVVAGGVGIAIGLSGGGGGHSP